MKRYGKKILFVFVAMNLVGAAVALFLENGLGSDSIGLLCDGISHTLGWRFGNASLVYNLVIIVVALLISKSNLGIGTVVYALCSGYFIDFYQWIFQPFQMMENPLALRILGFVVGQICLSLALALLIQLKLGMNALDALLYKIESLNKIPYAVLRTVTDLIYVIVGTIMGGTFGVGTICSVLLTGTMVSILTKEIGKAEKGSKHGIKRILESIQRRDGI